MRAVHAAAQAARIAKRVAAHLAAQLPATPSWRRPRSTPASPSTRAGKFSEKPAIFAEIIEDYFPNVPKIELNRSGKARPCWDAWGAEPED